MTTTKVLALLRRRLQTADSTAFFEDLALLEALEDARSLLAIKLVTGMAGYAIDTTDPDDGITPAPTDQHAFIMMLRAAMDLLTQRYTDLVQSGALGITWKSGLEEESTLGADKAYRAIISDLARELDAVILIQNRLSTGSRIT